MPAAAVGLLVLLSVQSYKATSRFINKRKSRKHGYFDLPTDKLGRPINEHGKRLTKNEAKALAAHNQEIQRIRTAERVWRAKGEELPVYQQINSEDEPSLHNLRRTNTAPTRPTITHEAATSTHHAPHVDSSTINPAQIRAVSASLPSTDSESSQPHTATPNRAAVHTLQGAAAAIRRRTDTASSPHSTHSRMDQPEIHDVFQHDGMDWRRATWEAPPIYRENTVVLANGQGHVNSVGCQPQHA